MSRNTERNLRNNRKTVAYATNYVNFLQTLFCSHRNVCLRNSTELGNVSDNIITEKSTTVSHFRIFPQLSFFQFFLLPDFGIFLSDDQHKDLNSKPCSQSFTALWSSII